MVIAPLSLQKDYWQNFELTDQDLEYLYSYLFDIEKPLTQEELTHALVAERIRQEKDTLEKQQQAGAAVYYPKEHYQVGQNIRIPTFDWQTGTVTDTRPGNNPEIPPFEVIEVTFPNGETRQLAAGLENHALNHPIAIADDDPLLDTNYVLKTYGAALSEMLAEFLEANQDLVRIAARWFPRALLVDINIGHLNLAEAVLDMMGGGPMQTRALMQEIDLPEDVDSNLNEFSLNLALQEDKRFDEVGPSGEVLWYLHRLEPEAVREAPLVLRFNNTPIHSPEVDQILTQFDPQVIDELEPGLNPAAKQPVDQVTLSLIYPHWRAGTLPLAGNLTWLFPTALESPRIQFTFVDGNTGQKFDGWVVRSLNYVHGLREWYLTQGLITGSTVHLLRGDKPGEVIIRSDKKRATREWIRTAVIGSDGGVVFSMLKHNLSSSIDERMAVVIPDTDVLDRLWEGSGKTRGPLSQTVRLIMSEMAKLSPQNHIHAQELYAGVNILRRCPPGPIMNLLMESPWAKNLGNLYLRLEESSGGDHD